MAYAKSLPLLSRALRRYGSVQSLTNGQSLSNVTTRWPATTPSTCRVHSLWLANGFQKSSISTTAPRSVVGWIQDKMANRAKAKKEAKLIDQIALMANSPTWTLKMFAAEIDETLSSWTTKIPGAGRTKEIQAAKASQTVVNAMVEHLGAKVSAGDLSKLDRKQKLKLVIACEKPMDELNSVINSFRQMEIMHRILRFRKENGIALPTDEEGLKMAMQQDGMKVMTKEEKQEMREAYSKRATAGKG
eukprot:CAMPEP_0172322652 /NCGR_PEP_ID=MMETSP1058-20130122/46506_1 /TAXON_ID=83371 /ORGANISM="Detonula confervacea, Strain CCMP 353" /LENGTH=245 /DNA_ID=CAMNT_0013038453 /DNA_START=17 /DNA_END=754 /DNA_ORIENTATION=-